MICIYSITNKINRKVYVGQTDNYARRYYHHIFKLSNGNSPIKSLQDDFNKYGKGAFEFKIEQECTLDELDNLEVYYIEKLNAFEDNGGYNANTGGKSGYKISQRTKNKQSETMKKLFKNDSEYHDAIVEHNRTMWNDPKIREKASKSHKERCADPEVRKQMS